MLKALNKDRSVGALPTRLSTIEEYKKKPVKEVKIMEDYGGDLTPRPNKE